MCGGAFAVWRQAHLKHLEQENARLLSRIRSMEQANSDLRARNTDLETDVQAFTITSPSRLKHLEEENARLLARIQSLESVNTRLNVRINDYEADDQACRSIIRTALASVRGPATGERPPE
jgi:predicted nuclease with TOPRIM domain